jgi:nitrogen fixation-related uncharacterized protein
MNPTKAMTVALLCVLIVVCITLGFLPAIAPLWSNK